MLQPAIVEFNGNDGHFHRFFCPFSKQFTEARGGDSVDKPSTYDCDSQSLIGMIVSLSADRRNAGGEDGGYRVALSV